jgi:hypothetical protein
MVVDGDMKRLQSWILRKVMENLSSRLGLANIRTKYLRNSKLNAAAFECAFVALIVVRNRALNVNSWVA